MMQPCRKSKPGIFVETELRKSITVVAVAQKLTNLATFEK